MPVSPTGRGRVAMPAVCIHNIKESKSVKNDGGDRNQTKANINLKSLSAPRVFYTHTHTHVYTCINYVKTNSHTRTDVPYIRGETLRDSTPLPPLYRGNQ